MGYSHVSALSASGRIAIAVADSTRRTRTILTLQVGNTGLAAARFRFLIRNYFSKYKLMFRFRKGSPCGSYKISKCFI